MTLSTILPVIQFFFLLSSSGSYSNGRTLRRFLPNAIPTRMAGFLGESYRILISFSRSLKTDYMFLGLSGPITCLLDWQDLSSVSYRILTWTSIPNGGIPGFLLCISSYSSLQYSGPSRSYSVLHLIIILD